MYMQMYMTPPPPKKNYWGWGMRCAEKLDQLGDVDFPLTMGRAKEFFGGGAKIA